MFTLYFWTGSRRCSLLERGWVNITWFPSLKVFLCSRSVIWRCKTAPQSFIAAKQFTHSVHYHWQIHQGGGIYALSCPSLQEAAIKAVTSSTHNELDFNLNSFINLRFSSLSIVLLIWHKCSFLPLRLFFCSSFSMHVASAAAATLWCFRSSSVRLYLTFISLSAFPSICLPVLALGGRGKGAGVGGSFQGSSSAVYFHCQSSMKENRIDFEQDSALDWILYAISCLCLCGSIPCGAR